ncbi:hypothetical protein [Paenibacillus radicibacter]|uniref:hypothetical protein n=1 Tax=Paenibacillus radicibacter TaxID=2972488 RepID=UPI002158CF9C|nr:hypothetical protein [Paenibacillus radicibacter]
MKQEHPEIFDEYKRYREAQISNIHKNKGTKVITLRSGYGGFGGQELIILGISEINDYYYINLTNYKGNEYLCSFEDFHKSLKIVDKFEYDWNLEDIETEDDEEE